MLEYGGNSEGGAIMENKKIDGITIKAVDLNLTVELDINPLLDRLRKLHEE